VLCEFDRGFELLRQGGHFGRELAFLILAQSRKILIAAVVNEEKDSGKHNETPRYQGLWQPMLSYGMPAFPKPISEPPRYSQHQQHDTNPGSRF
jgi:hypothetical protein